MTRDLDGRNDSLWRATREACLLWLIFVTVIQIPLDLLAVVDGYRMYMTPAELFHGVSVILLVDAAVIAVAAIVPSLLAGLLVLVRLVRAHTAVRWLTILHMTALAILSAYWLARAIRNWLGSIFEVNDAVLWTVFAVLIGVPVVVARLRRKPVLANFRNRVLSLRALAIIILALALAGVLSSDLSVYSYEKLKIRERTRDVKSRPNIILVSIDTLAAQDMSLYGYPVETTPKLERFAQASHVFDHFFANSNFTTPAVVSMLTGRYVDSHRVFQLEGRLPAGSERQNFVQLLSDAGYVTAAFVANPYAHPLHTRMSGSFDYLAVPPRRGAWGAMLGRVIRLTGINAQPLLDPLLPWLQPVLSRLAPEPDDITPFPAEAVFAQAQRFLDRYREAAPLFVWVHILPPHDPYLPPPPFLYSILPEKILDSRHSTAGLEVNPPRAPQPVLDKLRLRYDEHIRYADSETGRFLDYLEAGGYFRDSVILV
ncbi:MAG: sulfatase-like hydrolase/transferase, partial [Betaproteobacteria bacterium]